VGTGAGRRGRPLLQPAAARADSDGDCRWRGNHCRWRGPGGAGTRELRQHPGRPAHRGRRRRAGHMSVLEWMPFGVLLPLMAAPICALRPGRMLPWLLATASVAASAVIMAFVLPEAVQAPMRYFFGDWPPPI